MVAKALHLRMREATLPTFEGKVYVQETCLEMITSAEAGMGTNFCDLEMSVANRTGIGRRNASEVVGFAKVTKEISAGLTPIFSEEPDSATGLGAVQKVVHRKGEVNFTPYKTVARLQAGNALDVTNLVVNLSRLTD